MRSRPRSADSLLAVQASAQRSTTIGKRAHIPTRATIMKLPFIKRCGKRAFFHVEGFAAAEDTSPRLVSRIESALYAAGVQPEGANTPKDLIWVCLDDSKLSVEQIGDLLSSFGLTVHYLGDSHDN